VIWPSRRRFPLKAAMDKTQARSLAPARREGVSAGVRGVGSDDAGMMMSVIAITSAMRRVYHSFRACTARFADWGSYEDHGCDPFTVMLCVRRIRRRYQQRKQAAARRNKNSK